MPKYTIIPTTQADLDRYPTAKPYTLQCDGLNFDWFNTQVEAEAEMAKRVAADERDNTVGYHVADAARILAADLNITPIQAQREMLRWLHNQVL